MKMSASSHALFLEPILATGLKYCPYDLDGWVYVQAF
jgi:hypothetical protein